MHGAYFLAQFFFLLNARRAWALLHRRPRLVAFMQSATHSAATHGGINSMGEMDDGNKLDTGAGAGLCSLGIRRVQSSIPFSLVNN